MRGTPLQAAISALCLGLVMLVAAPAGRPEPRTVDQREEIDQWTKECLERDASTVGMLRCLGEGAEAWERELERVISSLLLRLPLGERRSLKESQKRWQTYREAEFLWLQAAYGGMDGSMYRVMHAADRLELVKSRARTLAAIAHLMDSSESPQP